MKKFKRIAAFVGVILLLSLYALSMYAGITKKPYSGSLLAASIFLTFAVPVFIYAFMLIYRLVHSKDNNISLKEFKKLNDKAAKSAKTDNEKTSKENKD